MIKTANYLKVILADTFGMYLNAHNFHWNVEGRDFAQLHEFFGNIYEETHDAVDSIAEYIRALDSYAPGSYSRFKELTSVEEVTAVIPASAMIRSLITANDIVIRSLRVGVSIAKEEGLEEIINFLGGRLEVHTKHGWMLKSFTKLDRE
jgi:starvation-inducible DNA-binding protein